MTAFRAEIVGSMLRPRFLLEARAALDRGSLSQARYKLVEDRAVDMAIAAQEAAGLDVISDGELPRRLFMGPLEETIDGVERVDEPALFEWHTEGGSNVTEEVRLAVTSKISRKRSLVAEEFTYARARAKTEVKVTVPSPSLILHLWNPAYTTAAYSSPAELINDAADVVRAEIQELVHLGCKYIQIDAPELTHFVDPEMRRMHEAMGSSVDTLLTDGLDLINSLAAETPADVTCAIHLCRGNNAGMWLAQGGYDEIATALFTRLPAFDVFLLEYDDDRSGSFEPLSAVPPDKTVVLGLITTKRPHVEAHDELTARIRSATQYIALEQLAVSTQCGFCPGDANPPLDAGDQQAKLALVADVAHDLWPA